MIKAYYSLTKPGMIRGNLIITATGFLLASGPHINFFLFFATLAGISFVIASGCVLNNYIDRDIDAKMKRTEKRVLVWNKVSGKNAVIFAVTLGLIGLCILFFFTNILTAVMALVGAFVYVALYSPLKHRTSYAALVGSIAGAVPIVIGYTAVTKIFDLEALILFLILILWQMPHFYSISIYRFDDYKAAGIPVMPVQKGIVATKVHILLYILFFIVAASALSIFGYVGNAYLIIALVLGIAWLALATKGFVTSDDRRWARHMFVTSLVVLMALSITISLSAVLRI